jgi:hypothetical protein
MGNAITEWCFRFRGDDLGPLLVDVEPRRAWTETRSVLSWSTLAQR